MSSIDSAARDARATRLVARRAHQLSGGPEDFDSILDRVGDATIVMIGTGSRGTHEFYRIRGELTKRLIREKGFAGVAIEADWADAQRVDRYARGIEGTDANTSLAGFEVFPRWEWRNADVLDFVGWLRAQNEHREPEARVGVFGLDYYSLRASVAAVLADLGRTDADAVREAEERFAGFDHFVPDSRGESRPSLELSELRERRLVDHLVARFMAGANKALLLGSADTHARLLAERLSHLASAAPDYYTTMIRGGSSAWSSRDAHMCETLEALRRTSADAAAPRKLVVWTHNVHVGDAHRTEMATMREVSLGELVRNKFARDALLVGFTTYEGTVTAARHWNGEPQRQTLIPAMSGSYELLFHAAGIGNLLLSIDHDDPADSELIFALSEPRLERAIGAVYLRESERLCHYYLARLPDQFDAVFYYDVTRALEPLDDTSPNRDDGAPENTSTIAGC